MSNEYHREDVHGFQRILDTPKEQLTKQELAGLFDLELLEFLQSKGGDMDEWNNICNENGIFAHYLTDHLAVAQP